MYKVVCNIPHSNTTIPDWAKKDMLLPSEELTALAEFMVDKDVDKIWSFVPIANKQTASMSRLVLDIERFRNDEDEPMSKKGMGVYYTHTPDGKRFRIKSEDAYAKCLVHYDVYHKKLEEKVTNCLEKYGECILIDCHSFHDKMEYTDYRADTFPDICIGVNGEIFHAARLVIDLFERNGYSVKVNEPFAGALVPLKYLSDNRVKGVMIELNRRIYDNCGFEKVQTICKEIVRLLNAK